MNRIVVFFLMLFPCMSCSFAQNKKSAAYSWMILRKNDGFSESGLVAVSVVPVVSIVSVVPIVSLRI